MQEERTLHEAKLAKMEAEMNLVNRQRQELEDKKMRVKSGDRLTPENNVSNLANVSMAVVLTSRSRRRRSLQFTHISCHFHGGISFLYPISSCHASVYPIFYPMPPGYLISPVLS